jgi:uncharacterized protein (DUF3820 family)
MEQPLRDPRYSAAHHTHGPNDMDPQDLQRLVTQTMPYGKFKGRLLADLPGHYLAWFAREGFPAGQLGRLLALMHEIDHNNLRSLLAVALCFERRRACREAPWHCVGDPVCVPGFVHNT